MEVITQVAESSKEGSIDASPVASQQSSNPPTKFPPLVQKKVVETVDEKHMHEIINSIFLGDIESSMNGKGLKTAGITHIVDMANTVELDQSHRGKKHFEVANGSQGCDWAESSPCIVAKLIVVVDDTEMEEVQHHFEAINEFVGRALNEGGSVLIHCVRGKSRSAAAVVQYLMQVKEYTLRTAMRTVYQGRPGVAINPGFKQQLQKLEAKLRPGEPPSIVLKVASKKPALSRLSSSKSLLASSASDETDASTSQTIEGVSSSSVPVSTTTRDKLPPFSPHANLDGSASSLFINSSADDGTSKDTSSAVPSIEPLIGFEKQGEDAQDNQGCPFTMSDSMPDIRAAAKKHGLSEKGTKRQILNRLIEKLGPSKEANNESVSVKNIKGSGIIVDLKNVTEFQTSADLDENSIPLQNNGGVIDVDSIVLPGGTSKELSEAPALVLSSSLPEQEELAVIAASASSQPVTPSLSPLVSSQNLQFSKSAPLPSITTPRNMTSSSGGADISTIENELMKSVDVSTIEVRGGGGGGGECDTVKGNESMPDMDKATLSQPNIEEQGAMLENNAVELSESSAVVINT